MATKRKNWEAEFNKLAAESRKLAKRANQRMVRLEDYSHRQGLTGITQFAYKNAQDYIRKTLGVGPSGKARYKEQVKLYNIDGLSGEALYKANVQIQKARIKAMNEFLEADTSTLGQSRKGKKTKGIKKIYDKRTETINQKYLNEYGLELTENDLKRFFESKKQEKLKSIVGSDKMFAVAAVIKKYNLSSNKREMQKFFKKHIDMNDFDKEYVKSRTGESYSDYVERLQDFANFTDDPVLNNYITDALKAGINAKNIFI